METFVELIVFVASEVPQVAVTSTARVPVVFMFATGVSVSVPEFGSM